MKNPHIGSDFDSFLKEEGLLCQSAAIALKRVIDFQQKEAVNYNHDDSGISENHASKSDVVQLTKCSD